MEKRRKIKSTRAKRKKHPNVANAVKRGADKYTYDYLARFKRTIKMAQQPLTKAKVLKRALNSGVRSCTPELLDRVEAFRKLRNEAEKNDDISAFYVCLLMDLYPKLEDEQRSLYPEAIYTVQFVELELKVLHKRIGPDVFDDFDNVVSSANEAKSETQNKSEMENNTMSNETKATVEVNAPVKSSNDRLLGGNIASAISGGVSGALTSVAIDFIFGTDQTTTEMAIDAGISAAIGAASGYATSRLCNMDDSSYLVNGAVGVGAGFGSAAIFRSVEAGFKNKDATSDLIQLNAESVVG